MADLIDRQQAIDALYRLNIIMRGTKPNSVTSGIMAAIRVLEDLPPVQSDKGVNNVNNSGKI